MRVVFDTDVVLASVFSPSGASRLWLRAALSGDVEMAISVPLLLEYEAVLTRPANLAKASATVDEISALLDAIVKRSRHVEISFLWRPTLTDPKDEMVLETALNGGAELLLSFNTRHFARAGGLVRVEAPGPAWRKRIG